MGIGGDDAGSGMIEKGIMAASSLYRGLGASLDLKRGGGAELVVEGGVPSIPCVAQAVAPSRS